MKCVIGGNSSCSNYEPLAVQVLHLQLVHVVAGGFTQMTLGCMMASVHLAGPPHHACPVCCCFPLYFHHLDSRCRYHPQLLPQAALLAVAGLPVRTTTEQACWSACAWRTRLVAKEASAAAMSSAILMAVRGRSGIIDPDFAEAAGANGGSYGGIVATAPVLTRSCSFSLATVVKSRFCTICTSGALGSVR
ncbi:hypothetical protein Vafri_4546 [Volvox africanus]|uniref:Uncharacterized protein n=1 Tax=Volvox africanus TaxID=51714 RepID=A0A8J4EW23_9CHLO|nr:hypothetical protein Vafri_4546 [Volvox africanus]